MFRGQNENERAGSGGQHHWWPARLQLPYALRLPALRSEGQVWIRTHRGWEILSGGGTLNTAYDAAVGTG